MGSGMKLLHVIDQMGAGGPARSLLAFARHARCLRPDLEHRVLSLRQEGYPPLIFAAKQMGMTVVRAPQPAQVAELVDGSDVVLLHFWNTPHFWEFLKTGLSARYVVWSKVMGTAHPQLLNRNALRGAAAIVLTADPGPQSSWEPKHAEISVVPGIADFGRVERVRPESHAGFNVDYIGTTNFGKLHPGFARIMSRLEIPGIRVRVCGGRADPMLAEAIETSRDPERFQCLGFVEDIAAILETSDVFGYPLSENTYATSDKSLQEAMYAGVPPVVFPHGGPARFVQDGKTGLVATSEEEFVGAIEYLYRNPDKRGELGRNAKAHARVAFAPQKHTANLLQVVMAAAEMPARTMLPELSQTDTARLNHAALFLVSQGWPSRSAISALEQWQAGGRGALDAWITSLPTEVFQVEGGIAHWRNHARSDPALRWWSALWLLKLGFYRQAGEEIEAASSRLASLGVPPLTG